MKGPPTTSAAALAWVKVAAKANRFVPTVHFNQQARARKVEFDSAKAALLRARRVEPYPAMPENGGTCWRVFGRGLEGEQLAIGVELFLDANEEWAILCTVIDVSNRRR